MAGNGNGSSRLDSWKAIAAYLGRDERTVQRWERRLALPVRRLPGGRGSSVFAYTAELDAWLAANEPSTAAREPRAVPPAGVSSPAVERDRRTPAAIAAAALALMATTGAWMIWRPNVVSAGDLRVELTPNGLTAYAEGREVWRHAIPGERVQAMDGRRAGSVEILVHAPAAVVAAIGLRVNTTTEQVDSGQLLSFSPSGTLLRSFAFDERVGFRDGRYGAPWGITDFRVDEQRGQRRIAVAAHHHEWWPSLVTILDADWRRTATFVHAGWIEGVAWLGANRLVVAGFSEVRDGGMIALLDPDVARAQTPVESSSPFYCGTCGEGTPLRYVAMPRSEINRATGSRFNRARLEFNGDRIIARTIEAMNGDHEVVDALYEFTPALDLVRASWSSRYWEVHGKLEAAGILDHPRATCPDRDGPGAVAVWDAQSGWRRLAPRR